MEVCLENDDLVELLNSGSSKLYKIPRDIAEKFVLRLRQLQAAYAFDDIRLSKSMNFREDSIQEGSYIIDVLKNYHLILNIEWQGSNDNITRIKVIDLKSSNDN